jgi:peroxiredoxin Q/BCP
MNDMADTHAIPEVGTTAPSFSLPDENGATVDLAKLKGRTVVLYFYPKADTPGCTKEACGFRDTIGQYTKANAAVFGVSPDPVADVKKFSDKFHLNFPLLADADHAVCEKFGVWQEKTNYGKKYMGVVRTTFIISPKGVIEHVFKNVKADGHEQEVLAWLNAKK